MAVFGDAGIASVAADVGVLTLCGGCGLELGQVGVWRGEGAGEGPGGVGGDFVEGFGEEEYADRCKARLSVGMERVCRKSQTHGAYAYARSSPVPFRYSSICASLKDVTAFTLAARAMTPRFESEKRIMEKRRRASEKQR